MLCRHFEPDDKSNSLDSVEGEISVAPNENEKARLRDTEMKATWMSDKHKSINFIMPCFSCRVLGPGRQDTWQVYPKMSTNLLPSALLCVTTQRKHCQQRDGMSASLVAYSGKAKALPWHILLNFDLIVPYGGILILYLNATLAVSAPIIQTPLWNLWLVKRRLEIGKKVEVISSGLSWAGNEVPWQLRGMNIWNREAQVERCKESSKW